MPDTNTKKKKSPRRVSDQLKVYDLADGSTEIVYRWNNASPVFFFLLYVVWGGIIWAIVITMPFLTYITGSLYLPIALLFISILVLACGAVALYVNKTIIHIGGARITVTSKPLNFPRPRQFNANEIDTFTIKKGFYRGSGNYYHTLIAENRKTRQHEKVIGFLHTYTDATLIQQEIESAQIDATVKSPDLLTDEGN